MGLRENRVYRPPNAMVWFVMFVIIFNISLRYLILGKPIYILLMDAQSVDLIRMIYDIIAIFIIIIITCHGNAKGTKCTIAMASYTRG